MQKKYVVYTGLRAPEGKKVLHCPLIKIVPRPFTEALEQVLSNLEQFSCLIFTSQTSVALFFNHLAQHKKKIKNPTMIAVGKKTAALLKTFHSSSAYVASPETAEGVLKIIKKENLSGEHFLWPRSALARPVMSQYFSESGIKFSECILYDTVYSLPNNFPSEDAIKEIIFTSPSTVYSYIHHFGQLPKNIRLSAIGPITEKTLRSL